jgi:hypothetical protein
LKKILNGAAEGELARAEEHVDLDLRSGWLFCRDLARAMI